MKAVRCPNGHWYDSEASNQCPCCGQSTAAPKPQEIEKPGKKGFSLFKKGKKSEQPAMPEIAIPPMQEEIQIPVMPMQEPALPVQEPVMPVQEPVMPVQEGGKPSTAGRFFADVDDEKTVALFECSEFAYQHPEAVASPPVTTEPVVPESVAQDEGEPLVAAVQRISAMEEGRTLSYFNAMTAQQETSSGAVAAMANPVVGWLVAISGPHLGQSFQIYTGKNTIGRNSSNKIVLSLDSGVSRENQATIIYEPKRRQFYLQSGSSDGLVYLNDTFINGTEAIKAKDVVELGMSRLIFIPLCSESFSWEQYVKGAES